LQHQQVLVARQNSCCLTVEGQIKKLVVLGVATKLVLPGSLRRRSAAPPGVRSRLIRSLVSTTQRACSITQQLGTHSIESIRFIPEKISGAVSFDGVTQVYWLKQPSTGIRVKQVKLDLRQTLQWWVPAQY
jgi:hypothetical protein